LGAIRDPALRDTASMDLDLAEGIIRRERDARAATELLSSYVRFADAHGKTVRLPTALVERARALRTLNDTDAALRDLTRAVEILERRSGEIDNDLLRDQFVGTIASAYEESIDVCLQRNEIAAAFVVSERGRSRLTLDALTRFAGSPRLPALSSAEVMAALPEGVALACYAEVHGRLLVFAVTKRTLRAATLAQPVVRAHELAELFRAAIASNDEPRTAEIGAQLYRLLISPLAVELSTAQTLVIIPSDSIAAIPFAALRNDDTFLVEQLPIVVDSSASAYAAAIAQRGKIPPTNTVLAAGAPAIDRTSFPDLPELPDAEREVRQIATAYGIRPLVGSEASADAVVSHMADADLIHLATHSIVNHTDPSLSLLVFSGNPGTLYAYQIARLTLRKQPVVVLAGCSTAASAPQRSLRNIADAFLYAGARAVVATQWDVGDEATLPMSLDLQRAIRAGIPTLRALRDAQVAFIRSTNPAMRAPRIWAAFAVYGTGM